MDKTKIFNTSEGQTVRLPEKYGFNTDEVVINKIGMKKRKTGSTPIKLVDNC